MLYPVNEIFYSIQGEGYWTGTPAIFIRLSGCNLNCPWCDTAHHQIHNMMTAVNIIDEAMHPPVIPDDVGPKCNIPFVLTGGEPTIHNYWQLIYDLKVLLPFQKIMMETNGSHSADLNMEELRENGLLFWVTISPKLAVEDCEKYFNDPHWEGDELKVVLDPNISDLKKLGELPERLEGRFSHYFIQPCSGDNQRALEFVKEYPKWRLSVQVQKFLDIR